MRIVELLRKAWKDLSKSSYTEPTLFVYTDEMWHELEKAGIVK